jgi:thiol-disulfide isomerase/thioredoxin
MIDPQDPYRKSIQTVDDLLDRGFSFSGHERNVCFLNTGATGGGRFATVSAASGFDFDDDARALIPVDWDGDGDLDTWSSNRTAPMLRFLRNTHNDSGIRNDWLQLRLEATRGARDGIGAKVSVILNDGTEIVRILKAGEGFLSQSSKWLHFGLGRNTGIRRVMVRWPGRREEAFSGISSGAHFILREGQPAARLQPARKGPAINGNAGLGPAESLSSTAYAGSRIAAPLLPWLDFDKKPHTLGGKSGQLTLVNLWATWCVPCVAELKELAIHHADLKKAGLRVVGLSVDGLAEASPSGDPAAMVSEMKLPFECGRATPALLRRVEKLRSTAWGIKWPLPVPVSLLLDGEGSLLAIYYGPVSPVKLLADLPRVSLTPEAFHDAALPFPGSWIERPNRPVPMALALDLIQEGDLPAVQEWVSRLQPGLAKHPDFPVVMAWIGEGLIARGGIEPALEVLAAGVRAAPNNITLLNNLAWQLASHPDEKIRNGPKAVEWAEKAAGLTANTDPSILDTLAAAYAQSGRFPDAVSTARKALSLAKTSGNQTLADGIQKGLTFYENQRAYGRDITSNRQ